LYRLIDKTDKIGLTGVAEEMTKEGIAEPTVKHMIAILSMDGTGDTAKRLAALGHLKEQLSDIPIAVEGITELEELTQAADALGIPSDNTAFDLTMVRGLGYYTGPIFETIITKPDDLGSVQGGGRYDELIGMFRGQSLPTTGISLGIERIIDLMDMLNLYPESLTGTVVQALVTVFNPEFQIESLKAATQLREAGIRTETFMDGNKGLGKQIGYADKKGVRLIVIMGPDEVSKGEARLKRLADTYEETIPLTQLAERAKSLLKS
jgi:histidyl-tRNA synthetase